MLSQLRTTTCTRLLPSLRYISIQSTIKYFNPHCNPKNPKILELSEITDAYGRIKMGLVGAGSGQEEELKPWSKNLIRARRHDESRSRTTIPQAILKMTYPPSLTPKTPNSMSMRYSHLLVNGKVSLSHLVNILSESLLTLFSKGPAKEVKDDESRKFDFLIVTDNDEDATAPKSQWRAITRKGVLKLSKDNSTAHVEWDSKSSDQELMSGFSYKGRGMELSDLTEYRGRILAPDDKTGIIFEIKKNQALPWVILNSGPGNTTSGMKTEWLTTKGSHLYAGGHGVEYRDENGEIFSEDQMWVKVIFNRGEVRNLNWKDFYIKIREAAGIRSPGYLTHEAVQWSEIQRKWFFLPRKASNTVYNSKADETKGTNLLIIAEPDFSSIKVVKVGLLEHPERGFSAFAFIPGTNDELIAALKSKEVKGEAAASFITVFNTRGEILMKDQALEKDYKFEGIYFL
ncbi:hypothetical protein RB195_013119 [Necator americanus]|uniref:Apyrase n=1 Tax=Necator americanus TaxID=51031 RepID=A0ABR1DU21_NECAM